MNLKKVVFFLAISVFSSGSLHVFAADSDVTREQFFSTYVQVLTQDVLPTQEYTSLVLKYRGIRKDTPIYHTMQKAVYYNLFPNGYITLPLKKIATEDQLCAVLRSRFTFSASCRKGMPVSTDWLDDTLSQIVIAQKEQNSSIEIKLTDDGYLDTNTLNQISDKLNSTPDPKNLSGFYNSIQSTINNAQDPYTIFFPPTQAEDFNEQLQGSFEGIGAYVDMTLTGGLIITSPILGSPADQAGLLAGDRILKIDSHRVNKQTSISTAVSWIKGKSGTKVTLLVLRNKKIFTVIITRAAVIIRNVAAKTFSPSGMNHDTICYMEIRLFGYGVYDEFATALDKIFGKNKCSKYVFDVRNNPGGSLDEVASMLNYFVPTGNPVVRIESSAGEQSILANDILGKKITDKITILMNQGSASASEIFAGTIKDYIPSTVLIGDTTYGKGSVQELLQYPDGSMLKHTIARRYTGKSKTTIDHLGIRPDIMLSDDPRTVEDEQLQAAFKN